MMMDPLLSKHGPLIDVLVFYEPEPPSYRIEAKHISGITGTVWVRADHAPMFGVDASDMALIDQEVDFMCRDLQAWSDESGVRDHGE